MPKSHPRLTDSITLSKDAKRIFLTKPNGRTKVLFKAAQYESGMIKAALHERAFDITPDFFPDPLSHLDIFGMLDHLYNKKIIDSYKYNKFGEYIIRQYNNDHQPYRQFLAEQRNFIASVMNLLPDNYGIRENHHLEWLISKLYHDDPNMPNLEIIHINLESFFKHAKITNTTDLVVLLEADITLMNAYHSLNQIASYERDFLDSECELSYSGSDFSDSDEKTSLYNGIKELIINLREFVVTYQNELYNIKSDKNPFTLDNFKKYMAAYVNNDFQSRSNILTELKTDTMILHDGALAHFFPDGLPNLSRTPVPAAPFVNPETLSFGFSPIKPKHECEFPSSEDEEDDSALKDYEVRKSENRETYSKKMHYSEKNANRPQTQFHSEPFHKKNRKQSERLSLLKDAKKILSSCSSGIEFLRTQALQDDYSDHEDSDHDFSNNFPFEGLSNINSEESTLSHPEPNHDRPKKAKSRKYIPSPTLQDDSCDAPSDLSENEHSTCLFSYERHKRDGAEHREKKLHYKHSRHPFNKRALKTF